MKFYKYLKFIIVYCSLFINERCFSQLPIASIDPKGKNVIDSTTYGRWPNLSDPTISPNGKYICYSKSIEATTATTLYIKSWDLKWTLEFEDVDNSEPVFTPDSKYCILKNKSDSLIIYDLSLKKAHYISNISSFKISGNGEWACCSEKINRGVLLFHFSSQEQFNFPHITSFQFNSTSTELFIIRRKEDSRLSYLERLSLKTLKSKAVFEGCNIQNIILDNDENKLAFINSIDTGAQISQQICCYNLKTNSTIVLTDNKLLKSLTNFDALLSEISFSKNGKYLFFYLHKTLPRRELPLSSNLRIWSYTQQNETYEEKLKPVKKVYYKAVLQVDNNKVNIIDDDSTSVIQYANNNKFLLLYTPRKPDYYYNRDHLPVFYIYSLSEQSRHLISRQVNLIDIYISQNEDYVIWFNIDSLSYFSYECKTHVIRNITKSIHKLLYDDAEYRIGRIKNFGIAGFCDDNRSVLIYDRYDIWRVDLCCNRPPINLTDSIGVRSKICFGCIPADFKNPSISLKKGSSIYLSAFNVKNKFNGYYKITLGNKNKIEELVMGPYSFYVSSENGALKRIGRTGFIEFQSAGIPIKSKGSPNWIIPRMSATEPINYFLSDDFKTFRNITDIAPQKKYNWLTSELLEWKDSSGNILQGILYKPENFDPARKYPIIITYYEKRSDGLYTFHQPDYSNSTLDIPTFVSNEYLIFVPDITYSQTKNGQSVINCISAALKLLSTKSWIDMQRIGLQGHSFGGWETNYLITHMNCFAAACEASGVSDQISAFGQISYGRGVDRTYFYEVESQGSPYGIGVFPWNKLQAYIDNSPVLFVDKVTTPLLIMHGSKDPSVPVEQAFELFIAMRRLGKPCWFLEYLNAQHSLLKGEAADYSIRVKQFFDYYLKNGKFPAWMK